MVRMSDLPESTAASLRSLELPVFDDTPWVEAPPLQEARVALVSTAGLHLPSDAIFRSGSGDYRVIPGDADTRQLVMSHASVNFDRSGFQQDVNVVFPLDRLCEFEKEGQVGSVARWHYSFMGATDPARMEATGPEVGRLLQADGVTAALLIPV